MVTKAVLKYGLFGCLVLLLASSCLPIHPSPRIDLFPTTTIEEYADYPTASCARDRPIDPRGVTLDLRHMDQTTTYADLRMSRLCWAANIAMISTYLGNPRSICQVASYMSRDGQSCCRLSKASSADDISRCNKGGYYSHVLSTLHQMGMYVLHAYEPLPESAIQLELSNGRPIVLQMSIDGIEEDKTVTWHHVVVIAGFEKGSYLVHDPANTAPVWMTYQELRHGKDRPWNWYESWYHFSYRQDGCNPRFRQDCDCR